MIFFKIDPEIFTVALSTTEDQNSGIREECIIFNKNQIFCM